VYCKIQGYLGVEGKEEGASAGAEGNIIGLRPKDLACSDAAEKLTSAVASLQDHTWTRDSS